MTVIGELLGDEGALASVISGYQPRAAQIEMAEKIAYAIESQQNLIAEAGTGTGKTFAYLIPAIVSRKKVIVSTGTKNLQDQLFNKDLPLIRKALTRYPFKASLLKGRANYLCTYRLEQALNSDLFATAVNQVAIAAGKDDSLPTLTGVFVEINKNQITLAATDRYRLAVRELTWSAQDANIETTSLLRARTLADAAKSLIGTSQVTIALAPANTNEKLVGFISEGKTMTSRVLDGSFPPFRHLLPTESTAEAIIEVAPFLDSVRRVALVTDKTVPLRLNFSNNSLQLEAGTGDEAQASEKLDINYKGEDINIAFNPTFLTDGLTAINTAFVHITFTGANKPAVLTGQTEAGSAPITNYKYLLMPMRYSS